MFKKKEEQRKSRLTSILDRDSKKSRGEKVEEEAVPEEPTAVDLIGQLL